MALPTKEDLELIGFKPSETNKEIYVRGDEQFDFEPSYAAFLNRIINSGGENNNTTKTDATIEWLSSIKKEIAEAKKKKN